MEGKKNTPGKRTKASRREEEKSTLGSVNAQPATALSTPPSKVPPLTDNPYYCVQHCSGFCCSEYTVLITIQDVKRIIKNIPGMHPYQFMTFYDKSVETLDYYPIINIEGDGWVIGMIQDEKRKTCPFHMAIGLCGIHDFSPMVCQTYPFSLTDDHEITYINNVKCPELFPPLDEERTRKIVIQSWREIDEYREMVENWNAKHTDGTGTFDEFMIFTGVLKQDDTDGTIEESRSAGKNDDESSVTDQDGA